MKTEINIKYIDDVYLHIQCEESISMELSEYFSFKIQNHTFHPLVRLKVWDGIKRLFDRKSKTIYVGLIDQIKQFAQDRGYSYSEDSEFAGTSFSVVEAVDYIKSLNTTLTPYDYQMLAFAKAIRNKRRLFLSPTNSGKSFIIYLITRYLNKKTLIITPTTGLILQLTDDLIDYDQSKRIAHDIHQIYEGKQHHTDKCITISTWQSIYKKPKAWFDQFEVIIGDEVHKFKAASLISIMEKTDNCKYKFGFTGTLDDVEVNEMVLEGLFGKITKLTTNKELIERKISSDINIKCIILEYSDEDRQLVKDYEYKDEIEFLVTHPNRNNFIANLANSLDGNVVILFRFIEQGDVLRNLIKSKNPDSPIYYVDGSVDAVYRNNIRKEIEEHNDAKIIASLGTFAEGVNIKKLNHIIFAHPSKGKIKVLQSIGRGLRRSDIKTEVTLFDISDNLSIGNLTNITLRHYAERRKIYKQEKFPYKQYKVIVKT